MCDLKVFYPDASYVGNLKPSTRIHGAVDANYQPPGVRVEYISYPVLPVVSRPLNGWVASNRLLPQVRAFQPDILLNYVAYPDGYAAVRIGRHLKVPVVLTAIGSDLNRVSDPFCAALTKSTLRHADFTITVSGDLLKTARRLGALPSHSQAILNGCDTTVFHPQDLKEARRELNLHPEEEIVTYVGRLDFRKGLVELIQAIAALKSGRPQLHCYLVGEGSDKPLLLAEIEKNNASACITLIPPCPTEKVALWMAASDLVTLPSYKEGCPNVVIEALAAGRPVVATNVGGIPELMDNTSGRLVPPGNTDALRKALEEVLSIEWDAAKISARHSKRWSDVAEEVFEVLRRTLAERSMD
jgi:glycosyltransferase involved in cell wall biosynthesis